MQDGRREAAGGESDEDDDGDLFRLRPAADAAAADGAAAPDLDADDALDASALPLAELNLERWTHEGAAEQLRNRFVTGEPLTRPADVSLVLLTSLITAVKPPPEHPRRVECWTLFCSDTARGAREHAPVFCQRIACALPPLPAMPAALACTGATALRARLSG